MNLAGRVDAVVIGASAGGIEALAVLLPALPAGLRPPVIIVLHLPRDRPACWRKYLRASARCRFAKRKTRNRLAPGTVYFAPTNYHLLVDSGPQLALSADDPVHHSRPSIDVLFESAAEIYGGRLLGDHFDAAPMRTAQPGSPPFMTREASRSCNPRRRRARRRWCCRR